MNGAAILPLRLARNEGSPGLRAVTRKCAGCRRSKSPTQFAAASERCKQCVLRTPK